MIRYDQYMLIYVDIHGYLWFQSSILFHLVPSCSILFYFLCQNLAEVDCIWMMETHVSLLQRNGDVRHIEFDINGELMRLADLFGDEGSEGKNTEIQ